MRCQCDTASCRYLVSLRPAPCAQFQNADGDMGTLYSVAMPVTRVKPQVGLVWGLV